ncbi:MAG TPA: ABC transporter permease [Acidimicrobiia bacterium]|jgi:ABC-2 type transport system permease protein|nr:ABC transporter permease [Acidimicrobiia bacterium]
MKPATIGYINVKRMLRERSNIFFVFILPIAIVLLIGVQFGGDVVPTLGVTQGDDGSLATSIVDLLNDDDSVDVRIYNSEDDLVLAVERGEVQAGVSVPVGMDSAAASGVTVDIGYVSRPDTGGVELQSIVGAAVGEVMAPVGAAQFASVESGSSFEESLGVAKEIRQRIEPISVDVSAVGEAEFPDTLGRFDLGAASQLVLFVFLTAITGASALIMTRQLGVSRRMLATPTSVSTIVAGESLGRFGTALVQGVYIMALTAVAFSVNWGDFMGAILILVALSAVGAGAGMLLGSAFSTSQQTGGIAVILGLGLAALGGAMVPIDIFSPTMRRIAHVTPHAWALDGYAELLRRGGTTVDILVELGVLTVYAVILLVLASWRLRVAITRP